MRTPTAADNWIPVTDDICILSQSAGVNKDRHDIGRRDSVLKYLLTNPQIGKIGGKN